MTYISNPQLDYLRTEIHKSVEVEGKQLTSLEKAIVGYAHWDPSQRIIRNSPRSTYYREIEKLVFDYLVGQNRLLVASFIKQNIKALEKLERSVWESREPTRHIEDKINHWKSHYTALSKKGVDAIDYDSFYPHGFRVLLKGESPFANFVRHAADTMKDKRILIYKSPPNVALKMALAPGVSIKYSAQGNRNI